MISMIVLHCSASPHGRGDNAATIHRRHKERGFDAIGYHHVILEDGTIEQGRPHWWQGAHVRGHNENSLGICMMGDPERGSEFTDEQIRSLKSLQNMLTGMYPSARWYNHYDLDPNKSCPGMDLVRIIDA